MTSRTDPDPVQMTPVTPRVTSPTTPDLIHPLIPRFEVGSPAGGRLRSVAADAAADPVVGDPVVGDPVVGDATVGDPATDARVIALALAASDRPWLRPGGEGPVAGALTAHGVDPGVLAALPADAGRVGEVTLVPTRRARTPAGAGAGTEPLTGEPESMLLALYGVGDAGTGTDASPAPFLGGRSDLAIGAGLGRALRGRRSVEVLLDHRAGDLERLVEGLALGGYSPPRWGRPLPANQQPAERVRLVPAAGDADAGTLGRRVDRAVVRARATLVARNLAFTPSNLKSPAWLAEQARAVGQAAGLGVTVRDEGDLGREGFGGLLAVGGGSASPPRLVQLTYAGAAGAPHVVLVGKGITFDSGGLNIKPTESMVSMKSDMAGAGVVLAVLAACAELRLPVRVTGLLPLAENAMSGSAYRPGDVVTHYGGRTLEIGNTDAEGRVVLADALAYADAVLDPDVLVDIATLTGAATAALGRGVAPLYATDDPLAEALVAAGRRAGEPLWRFPLVRDYRPQIDSAVADVAQIAGPKPGAGSIMAALMLAEFTGGRAWAHLDIAGTGRADADGAHVVQGPTGFGARVLLTYLEELR